MSFSLNEITATCKRAARGAGLSWGLAEEAGYAANWLTSHSLPGPEILAAHLSQIDGAGYDQICPQDTSGIWQAKGGALCPLITGAAICDLADEIATGRIIKLGRVSYPLLLLPFVAAASVRANAQISLSWAHLSADFDPALRLAAPDKALTQDRANNVQISAGGTLSGAPVHRKTRGDISPDAASILGFLGHRTYAPDTAQSRLSGAGAGLSGND
jgi:hypothetical protein